jgi:hypothetical protein
MYPVFCRTNPLVVRNFFICQALENSLENAAFAPDVPFIASGGVDEVTATGFIRGGSRRSRYPAQLIPPEV